MPPFVHLHVHTEYSLLDGAGRIPVMLAEAKKMGMSAMAITDHGNMYGILEFQKEAQKLGMKPILGCELYMARRTRNDKEGDLDRKNKHITLLVKNEVGYRNLTNLVTKGYTEGFYYKPRIDFELLTQHHEGLVALSGCMGGEIPRHLLEGNYEQAKIAASKYKELFGNDYYIEIMDIGIEEQTRITPQLIALAKELDIPLVATNDVHYAFPEDAESHDVLLCLQTNSTIDQSNRMKFNTRDVYLRSPEEMANLFINNPEALSNTVLIAEKCNFQIPLGQYYLPDFPVPEGDTPRTFLEKLCHQKISERYPEITTEISERLEIELNVIVNMGFAAYFLIVQDFMSYARAQGIPVGPGRGSAAGSIVAYILGITDIDPLKYDLLFERFLNPERVSMPDIDIDFCIRRRDEVLQYVSRKYGEDHVSQIITFGTMAARAVIRDVGRVYNIPLSEVDRAAKLIPATPGITIEEALKLSEELSSYASNNAHIAKLIEMAKKLEGLARHAGTHAAGVVISKEPLTNYVPLQLNDGQRVCQLPMGDVEALGLLKMDFLGLRNLTIIDDAIKAIKYNQKIDLDIAKIPLDDPATYKLLQNADTFGVFQLESRGMRALIKDMIPTVFEDLIALLALYRPGPLGSGMVKEFIDNKHGRKQVQYLLPQLEPILKETHGLILYQEQVIKIASVLGGFSLGQADLLRRAMGKKKMDVMDKQKLAFIEGAKAKQIDEKKATHIFDLITKFAEYGFNKSHSAAYAVISYQTAYLKANYPLEFMAALLTSVSGTSEKVSQYILDTRRSGIDVLPPDVNESLKDFTVTRGSIRFGLTAIKNLGANAIENIIEERTKNGAFVSISEFCTRVDLKVVNKRSLESLIKVGAMGSFGNRRQLLEVMENVLSGASRAQKERSAGQTSLFDLGPTDSPAVFSQEIDLPDLLEFPPRELLKMEKELAGLYMSDHPLNHVQSLLERDTNTMVAEVKEKENGEQIVLGGLITTAKKIITKTGKPMITGTFEDLSGSLPIVLFPGNFDRCEMHFNEEEIVLLHGKVSFRQDEPQVVVDNLTPIRQDSNKLRALHLNIELVSDMQLLQTVQQTLTQFRGIHPVYLHTPRGVIATGPKNHVDLTPELTAKLVELLGKSSVWEE